MPPLSSEAEAAVASPWRGSGSARAVGRRPAPRLAMALVLLACAALAWWLQRAIVSDARVSAAFLAGLVAAGATALGTLPLWRHTHISDANRDALLGFGAGVMLAAASFSLIIPGLEAAASQGDGPWRAGLTVGFGIILGAALLMALDRWLPHEHFVIGNRHPGKTALKRTWLFVFAISLHNLPEGLAIGVAYAGTDLATARTLATGIAIQDVPEGLVVALALVTAGYRRIHAVALAAASGAIEPVGAVLGAAAVGVSAGLLPLGLAFAAGAMLWVISHEIIPESHRGGHESRATTGLMAGFVLMMVLDTALG